tara:strand:- start:2862 stop:3908 length:1047 start_codon:yes stop_codon:yes gene_type:complete
MEIHPVDLDVITSRIPEFELSYETVSHMKVVDNYDMVLALPTGRKGYLWFTTDNNYKNVCYLFETNRDKQIVKGVITPFVISDCNVSLGTLIYGTIIICQETDDVSFVFEDMLSYHGQTVRFMNNITKFHYTTKLLHTFQYHTDNYHVFMPITWTTTPEDEFTFILPDHISNKITYNVHHLQYRSSITQLPYVNVFTHRKINPVILPAQPNKSTMFQFDTVPLKMNFKKPQYKYKTIFQVVADIQYDIYHLFAYGKNNSRVYYNLAYVPTYNSSVSLNNIFRKIRENESLDYIEESDDEEDFENMNEDKYVDLNKVVSMECTFHYKFKKWVPERIVYDNTKIVHISQL